MQLVNFCEKERQNTTIKITSKQTLTILEENHRKLKIYPIMAENGHPTIAPAATPKTAKGVES